MSSRKLLKFVHLCGTAWFVMAAVFVILIALRQAGVNWWVIFSFSGQGAALLFVLISAYLYVLVGNKNKDPQSAREHPLTNTRQYGVLYSLAPFLGTFAGLLCTANTDTYRQIPLAAALSTFWATFLFWIIVDPLIGSAEMLLPASRKIRSERNAHAKFVREQRRLENERLLANIENEDNIRNQQWHQVLGTEAKKLAELTVDAATDWSKAESQAIAIGLQAWRYGGLECMQKLCQMASDIGLKRGIIHNNEYISIWWDGIGLWRHKLLS